MPVDSRTKVAEKFPVNGTFFYNLIHFEAKSLPNSIKWFRRLNRVFVIPMYRLRILPLFGIGKIFLLLTTTGRKSMKKRRTPLEFHRINDKIHIISSRGEKADWIKNMRTYPNKVWVQIGFHGFKAEFEIIEDAKEREKFFYWYSIHHPKAAKTGYGWEKSLHDPETADFSLLAKHMTIVRIHE
ncbi:MAG: nitroreductase family deazaflavin-dependent oxidoreductase [Candidatus Hodarchaeales archaeon]|jgi:deazaflavin-dependent oxidoreductase (nitroreductase family)